MKHMLSHKKTKYLLLSFLLLLQLAFVHAYLPIGEWFSPNAIYTDDFSFHYGHVLEKITYLREFGKMWGYNPFIRAGSVANANTTIDNNGCVLFSFLLFFLPVAISFKLYFILGIALVPILCYKSARNFDFIHETALLSSFLGTLLMHVSVMVNFIYWGTISFIFSAYIALLTVSYFYRFCLRGRLANFICATLLLIAALWIHAFAGVILAAPLLLCYALFFRRMSWTRHAGIAAAPVLTALAIMPWAYPFLIFLDYIVKDTTTFFYKTTSLVEPLNTYVLRRNLFNTYMNTVFHKEEWVDILLLLTALLGLYLWSKDRQRPKALLFLGSIGFLFFLSYYGSFFNITDITPMRFIIPLNIFLVLPAAEGLQYLYRFFLGDKGLKVKVVSALVAVYLLIVLAAPAYYHLLYKNDFRLVHEVPPVFNQLVSWINNNTTKEGRILIESSDFESGHQYYGTHLPFLLPLWTDREYIDGYSYYAASKDSFATYNTGFLFRKPIGDYSPEELQAYFELYNITWIIYWSEASQQVFASGHKGYTHLTCIDKFHISRVERKPTFFIKGRGVACARHNEIHLQDVQSADDEIIISYHWMKYLKTEPPLTLEKTYLLDDPIGFIKIKNPPSSLLIYNSYQYIE